jgi:hypothetical protein
MEYQNFLSLLMNYKKLEEDLQELNSMGFDFYEGKYKLSENIYGILHAALESHYTTEGIDWISWFIFENDYGTKDWSKYKRFNSVTGQLDDIIDPTEAYGAKDENGNPICYSFESTWEFTKQYLKKIKL